MDLQKLRLYIESFPVGTIFPYSLSHPFSWRGSYDEVAFDISDEQSTREATLENIQFAYLKTFYGYKGGEYKYTDYTEVHFEKDSSYYSDGAYCAEWISKIELSETVYSQEERLMKLAFVNSI